MNGGNEPEMKTDLEMNGGLEMNETVEMNTKHITKNTQKQSIGDGIMEYSNKDLIKKVEEIDSSKIKEELLNILKEKPDYININKAKTEIQKGYVAYISGAKFVTTEDSNIVLKTIRKDLMIYPNIIRFVVRGNIIDLTLDSNATLYSYYFLNQEVLTEVLEELPKFNIPILKL